MTIISINRIGVLKMYQVAVLKADYEGWWLFEGWQEELTEARHFSSEEAMLDYYWKLVERMMENFHSYQTGKYDLMAFYNACELEYCEECEEDLQIYYTPICLKNDEFLEVRKNMNI